MSKPSPSATSPFSLKGLFLKGGLVIAALLVAVTWLQLFPLAMGALGLSHPWLFVIALPLWLALPLIALWLFSRSGAESSLKDLWQRREHLEPGDRGPLLRIARELALTGEAEMLKDRAMPLLESLNPGSAEELGEALESLESTGWDPVFDALDALDALESSAT